MGIDAKIIVKNEGMNPEYSGDPSKLFNEIGEFKFTSFDESITNLIHFYEKSLSKDDINNFRKQDS